MENNKEDKIIAGKPFTTGAIDSGFEETSTVSEENEPSNSQNQLFSMIYPTLHSLTSRIEKIEKDNSLINSEIQDIQKKENRLLNRFAWLIFIVNVGLILMMILLSVLFIDLFYPFVKELVKESKGALWVIGTVGTLIGGAIFALWIKVCSFAKYVMDRDKGNNPIL